MTPHQDWQAAYAGWRALDKLQYVDRVMAEVSSSSPDIPDAGEEDADVSDLHHTLAEHYHPFGDALPMPHPGQFDADLLRILPEVSSHDAPAGGAAFLRAHQRQLVSRVALWSGEEEGEYGSFAYVKDHFGSAEQPKPEFTKLQAYWNIDDGTGLVRGASIFGPPAAATALAQYLKPFEDWGIYGALPSTARVEGGSDNGAFAVAGLGDPVCNRTTRQHAGDQDLAVGEQTHATWRDWPKKVPVYAAPLQNEIGVAGSKTPQANASFGTSGCASVTFGPA